MDLKTIVTGNISSIHRIEGSSEWMWGTDYTYGDLYEAEELYEYGSRIVSNRLILVNRFSAQVFEPVAQKAGQYFGKPVVQDGKIMILAADFSEKSVRIVSFDPQSGALETEAKIPRSSFQNCYNLSLQRNPLMLTRIDSESFDVIWPVAKSFAVKGNETFCFLKDGRMYFSRWFEDPDYREETFIRDFETGETLEVIRACLCMNEDGQWWMLKENE